MLPRAEQRRCIPRRGQHTVGRVWFTSSSASDSISWFPRCIAVGGSNIMESRRETSGYEKRVIDRSSISVVKPS